ncbi:MAG: hypothetical protein ACYTKD_27345 [Planctomycetota bacterium]|jgi:hypothetical protein
MSVETAELVFFAITGVMVLVWLGGTAFAFSRLKPRGRGGYDVAPSPGAAEADAVVGETTVEGEAEAVSKKIAEQLVATTSMGGMSPLQITERTAELVAFKRSMGPGGPAAVFDEGLFRLRAEGGKVRVQYAVSVKRFARIMKAVTYLVCFLWGGIWVIGVPVFVWFLAVHHANKGMRMQTLQTFQMIHGVWPPFLVGFMGGRLRRMTAKFFETFLSNLQHIA